MQQHQYQKSVIQHQNDLLHQHKTQAIRTRDLRDEMPITKAKAFEEMSAYHMFRFEEARDDDDDDDDDDDYNSEREKPRWLRVTCMPVPGMAKEAISREVRKLDKETGSVADKKATLTSAQLRHIEATLEEQKRMFDPNIYEINLVQLDHNLQVVEKKGRKVSRSDREHHRSHPDRRSSKTHRISVLDGLLAPEKIQKKSKHGRRDRGHGKTKDSKPKKVVERAYITAYFKTSPRPAVDPVRLYYEMQAINEAQREAREKRVLQPPQPPQPPEPLQQEAFPGGAVQIRGRSQSGGPDQGRKGRSTSRKQSRERSRPRRRRSRESSPTSSHSHSSTFTHSDDMSSTSSMSTGSRSRSPPRGRNRNQRKLPFKHGAFHEQPGHFGMGLHQSRRHRIDDSNQFGPVAIDVEQLEQEISNAYATGRAHERQDRRELAKDIAVAAAVLPKRLGLEQDRYEHVPPTLRITHRPRRNLDDRMDSLGLEDWETDDDDYDNWMAMRHVVPPPRRRGPVGGLRERRGGEYVPRRDVEVGVEVDRRVRDHNEYLAARVRHGARGPVVGSPVRGVSYERISPLSSDDGLVSPDFEMRRRPYGPMGRN
jgi:predicted  nucleic acid-binding Zn-ribbon protein